MIDTACILFSAFMCVFMAFRAIRLDRAMAWFAGALPAIRAAGAAMIPAGVTCLAAKSPGWRGRAGAAEPDEAPPRGWRGRPRRQRPVPRGRASRAPSARSDAHAS